MPFQVVREQWHWWICLLSIFYMLLTLFFPVWQLQYRWLFGTRFGQFSPWPPHRCWVLCPCWLIWLSLTPQCPHLGPVPAWRWVRLEPRGLSAAGLLSIAILCLLLLSSVSGTTAHPLFLKAIFSPWLPCDYSCSHSSNTTGTNSPPLVVMITATVWSFLSCLQAQPSSRDCHSPQMLSPTRMSALPQA